MKTVILKQKYKYVFPLTAEYVKELKDKVESVVISGDGEETIELTEKDIVKAMRGHKTRKTKRTYLDIMCGQVRPLHHIVYDAVMNDLYRVNYMKRVGGKVRVKNERD